MPDTTFTIHGKNLTKEAIAQLKADIEKTTKALHEQAGASVEVEKTTKKTATSYTGLTVALGATSAALGLLTKSIVSAAMTQERMMKSLDAVEGGAKNAEKAMLRLREVAKMPGLNLQQAVQGYTNLRAIDMNAQLAERSLKAFGNALVTVGKGAPELQLVILALTQMSAKGKVLGQDLRQLQEQLPQIRKVMKDAFGTADVEAVQKKLEETGQTADDFIKTIVSGFEKLPKVVGGTANAVENFNDQWTQTKVLLGEALLPILTKVLDKLGDLMNLFNQLPKPIQETIGLGIAGGAGLAGIGFTLVGIAKVIPTIKSGLSFLPKAFSIFSTGALASLGPIAIMLAEILGTVYALRKALTEPIDIKAIDKATDKATLGKLNKAKAVVEKQMTRAEYKSGDYTNTETRYGVSDLYPNLDPMITAEDLLERINNQIDMIQNKTAGKESVVQAIYGDPKEIKTVFDFEEIKKQLDDLMNISSTGYGMSKERQKSWLSDWLARPQALTEDAKIGIRNTIKDLQTEIDKEAEKAKKEEAERIKKLTEYYSDYFAGLNAFYAEGQDYNDKLEEQETQRWERIDKAREAGVKKQAEGYADAFSLFAETPDWFIEQEEKKETDKWDNLNKAQQDGIKQKADELAQAFELFDVAPDWFIEQETEKETKFWDDLHQAQAKAIQEQAQTLLEGMELYGEISKDEADRILKDTKDYISNRANLANDIILKYGNKDQQYAVQIQAVSKMFTKINGMLQEQGLSEIEIAKLKQRAIADITIDTYYAPAKEAINMISAELGQLPIDLLQNFDDIGQVIENFFKKILNSILGIVGQIIAEMAKIKLMDALSDVATEDAGSGGFLSSLLKIGISAASMLAGPAGVVPTATAGTAGLTEVGALFFDDPHNDMMAYKSGEKSALVMTRKSSIDFINNFEKGFTNSNQSASGEGGLGGKLDKLIGLMENTKYEFYLDSDPIVSTVRKKTNKKIDRGEWAK